MNYETSFKRIAAISAIISAPLAVAGLVIVTLAVDFDFELMSDQSNLITLGARSAGFFHWGEFLSIFGYYLLLIPVALYLWHWLRPHDPNLVNLYTVCGLGFIFIGVPGAIMRTNVLPEMMRAYAEASGAQREVLEAVFKVLTEMAFTGGIGIILLGIWWLGIGLVLRSERRLLGIVTTVLGIAALGVSVGTIFHIEPLIMLEGIVFLLSPFWALWLGIVIWRRGEQSEQRVEEATAA
ncbi:MAG: DUF4386 family protein [Candidatus Promineifilaceae bacterium]|nr:DUF4386 family protein [Candidatus Promineifilaceae bacterium]